MIILVGVLSAVAIGKFADTTAASVPAFSDQAQALLRYGQKLAIAQNRPIYVQVGSNSLGLCANATCSQQIAAPSGSNSGTSATVAACGGTSWYCEAAPTSMSVSTGTPFTFFFDREGRPFLATDGTTSDTSNFTGLVLTIAGSTPARTVTVERETGYVH